MAFSFEKESLIAATGAHYLGLGKNGGKGKSLLKYKELLSKATAHVEALFRAKKPGWVKFHTFRHARAVAKASQEIGAACSLSEEDLEVVTLAAWFHDTGYLEGIEGHEERSVQIASAYLRDKGYPEEKIARIAGCIRATEMPQNPKSLVEQVLCDADIAHLASKDFFEVTELIRRCMNQEVDAAGIATIPGEKHERAVEVVASRLVEGFGVAVDDLFNHLVP